MTELVPITQPLFELTIPSSGAKIHLRPMLVKEEKVLLMAKEGKEENQILIAVKQVVQACMQEKILVDGLTTFDIEYLFLHIRAQSVESKVKVTYKDAEDQKEYPFEIDLNTVEVKWPNETEPRKQPMSIKLSDTSALTLKYPMAAIYNNKVFTSGQNDESVFQELVLASLDTITQNGQTISFKLYKKEDIVKFLDNLTIPAYNKIREFFANMPSLFYEIKYTNAMNNEKTITMRTLFDFFTF